MKNDGTVARKRIDAQLRAAVIRGVRRYDERDPYWWNGENTPPAIEGMTGHIDLETLDMAYAPSCVIGQRIDGNYFRGARTLGLRTLRDEVAHGFNIAEYSPLKWSVLTELWASVIQSRRYPRRKIASDPWVKKANETWVRA